jgi:thiol peroxidase
LLDNDLKPVKLSDFRGKVIIIAAVPSLDTPVCDMETRRFNTEAARLGKDVAILTVSMDLPFAQKRWCGAAGVEQVKTLSDHKEAAFGQAFGLLIKELRLLGRAVLVLDREGVVRYYQLVKEVSEEPDYEAALSAVKELV